MTEIIFTIGLPGSGKTTWAKELIKDNPEVVKRINKDDLRAMIDNSNYTSMNESMINDIILGMVTYFIETDEVEQIIIDGCNLQKHIDYIIGGIESSSITKVYDHSLEIFNVEPHICIERNAARKNSLPEKVIWNMLDRYHQEDKFTQFENEGQLTGKPWKGVDLDGTLAYYENWKGANHIGEPIDEMMNIVKGWIADGERVKIFTARAGIPEQVPPIRKWLIKYGLDELEITNVKDFACITIYDDRCVQVRKNQGTFIEDSEN